MHHGHRHFHASRWIDHRHCTWLWIAHHDLDLGIFLHQDLQGLVIQARILLNLDLFDLIPPVLGDAALAHQRVLEQRIGGHETVVVVGEDVVRIVGGLLRTSHVFWTARHVLDNILTREKHFHQAWQHGTDGVSHLHRHHLGAPIFFISKGVTAVVLSPLGADG